MLDDNDWDYYKRSTEVNNPSSHAGNVRDRAIPHFSSPAFIERLVCFIVADDQVSPNNLVFFLTLMYVQSIRVVECPEFRQLCMVLRETLVEADIPGRYRMREAIISRWKQSFKELKVELSVSLSIMPSFHANFNQ